MTLSDLQGIQANVIFSISNILKFIAYIIHDAITDE